MSTNPYVDSKQLIDVEREKPYELIHERAFVNVSIATGWQPSDDGLYEYYKDIILPVADNEEPVTMSYSPMVIIPQNANPSCRPTNFPYARTVAINTVRLYAYRVPDPMAILPVTITVKEVMSNEGMTNAGAGGSDSNITIEKTVLQVKGTSFLVPVDNDNITTEEVKIEMYMTAYKGEEKTKATIGNIESIDVLFNMDGTVINTADNNIEITTLDGPLDDPNSAIFWATIPKGTLLKDKMAYFVVPISAGTPFHARSTLLTTRTGETVNKISRYEIFYPSLSRSSTGNYYQNGEAVGSNGIRFTAKSYTANGVSADVNGYLVFRNNTNNSIIARSSISAGVVDIIDTSIFNDINDLKIELETGGKVVETIQTSITTSVSDISIRISSDYLVPIMSDNGSIVPAASVELWVHTSTNFVEQFYGRILVKNEDGTTLIDSVTPVTKVRIEEKEYDSSSIPAFYRVDVFRPGELVPAATKFISILKKGDATIPVMLDVTPSAMIILADKDGNIPSDIENVFKARVLKGVNDVSTDWVFSQSVVSGIVDISQTGNTFKVTSISSQAAVVEVSATMSDGVDVLTQQMTITKIVQSDNGGNYTFLKYGELIMDDEDETGSANGTYQFTIDPDGILPPGVVKGSYYGIAISEVDEAPTDPAVYIWSPTGSLDSTNGQQEIPTGSFIIDGESIIKAVSDDTGEVVLYPNVGGYEVKSLGDVSAISYKWEYRAGDIWTPLTNLENDAATMSIDYSALPFNAYNSAAIRVKVQAVVNGEIRDYFAQLNIYIIYAAQASYFGQLRLIGGVDRYSHTFPIDRFGQAISGTTSTRDTVRLTADIYKGLDRLEAVDHDNNLGDGEYRVISVSDAGASLSHSIFENQFSAVYDFLIGSSGSTAVVIETRDNRLNLSFNWLTVNSQASISSSVIAIPDKTDFVINDATLWDIENWNDDIAVSPVMLSSLDKNNPIIVDFETNNTNVEKVEISNSGGSDMYQIGTSLGYLQELEEGDPYENLIKDDFSDFIASDPKIYINEKEVSGQMSPISVISSKESDGYHGFMLPDNYYLVVTNSTGGTPKMDLFQDNIIVESLEMNNDYLFSGSRAMIVKPAAGVTRFVYSDPGDETPYIFKFNPVEKFHELITNQYFVGSKLNTVAAGLTAPMYGGILPIKYNEVTDQPYSFGVHPNGAGYMRIQPEIASRSTFFSNMFANSNTTIKVTATTGESTRFSIYRRVYPNKEISDIGNDIKSIFRGDYLDKSDIYSLETSSSIIKSERDQLVDMIEVVDVEAFEEERAPRDVDTQYYYESVGDLGQVYPIDTKASGLAVDEINHESVMGMSLFSDSYYFISVGLKSTAQVQAEISLVNRSTREVIGTIKKTVSTTEVPVKFVVPPAGVKTVDNKIQTYIKKYGLSTANVTDVFTRRTTNSDYAPYYLHVRVTSNNPPDTIDMVSNDVKELNEERVVRTNIYSGLSGKNPYEQMKSSTTLYIDTINTVIDRINSTADGDRIPTSDYPNLFSQFNEAKNFIEKTKTEMDIINRRGSMESTFRQSSDARGFIMGYANSQEYISSLQLTPLGLLVKGDKNQVVGSTSIGELYGKKIVIGKTITKEDIEFDKVYRNSTKGNEGFFAVWDENNKVWSSTINKDGQFFMRYRDSEAGPSLIGYMVMNSSEIAAYDFQPITTGLDLPEPVNVHEIQQKTSIFSINDNGSISINKLVINDTPTRRASVDLMGVIRISKYTSADQSREGIVFTQIGGA